MPVPTYDRFIDPILRHLAARPEGASAPDIHDAVARVLGLTDADRAELLPSGTQFVYKNRANWGHDRLKRAGLSTSIKRGVWRLTEAGQRYARENAEPLSDRAIAQLAEDTRDVRLKAQSASTAPVDVLDSPNAILASPTDRLEQALSEIRETVVREVLEALHQVSAQRFEIIVLEVLHAMGYGASAKDLKHVGRAGDGGIDGIIALDRLGLEKVYVQAKRWQGSVGAPEVQGFYGALEGRRANKGVIITPSGFTKQAIDCAKSLGKIVLVDGRQLASLMTEYEIGVSLSPVKVPKLDSDYFDE